MRNTWSKYIQTSEELYCSRDLRFNEHNRDLWLKAIGAGNDDVVLEVGCGSGAFCHKLKKYVPGIRITGLDNDAGHIGFARRKTAELGLQVEFVLGNATAMPFADNTFDLCFSHTVSAHIPHEPFFGEQYRVLKSGGRIVVLSVRTHLGISDPKWSVMGDEERELLEKAWSNAGNSAIDHNVGAYEIGEHEFPAELEKAGFRDVNIDIFSFSEYAPDNASVPDELAIRQINCRRIHSLASVQKALNLSPRALTESERDRLVNLINERYDKRIEQYRSGVKLWDFSTTTVLVASGRKQVMSTPL